jgi:putative transposase
LKHTPAYPRIPFNNISIAQQWPGRFVGWYNLEHRHSAIRYLTPDERHCGRENDILDRRHELYQRARDANPERWTSKTPKLGDGGSGGSES